MAMVSNKFLGSVAVKLGFHRHLFHYGLQGQITNYAGEFEIAEEENKSSPDSWMMVTSDPPKASRSACHAFNSTPD